MIGLIVLGLAGLWLLLSFHLTKSLVDSSKFIRGWPILGIPLFIVVAALPFTDEIIGRWQFHKLCTTEAKVWISSNAGEVEAAIEGDRKIEPRKGIFFIPVREQYSSYVDAKTGKPFYSVRAFHTPGGLIMRGGLNMGSSSSCWPKNWTSSSRGLDIDTKLKRGKLLQSNKE